MKVLLDEQLPHKLRLALTAHEVSTVDYLGWKGLKNGELLRAAEDAGFEVFLTGDKNLSCQQSLCDLRLAVLVLSTPDWPRLRLCVEQLSSAIERSGRGSAGFFDCAAN